MHRRSRAQGSRRLRQIQKLLINFSHYLVNFIWKQCELNVRRRSLDAVSLVSPRFSSLRLRIFKFYLSFRFVCLQCQQQFNVKCTAAPPLQVFLLFDCSSLDAAVLALRRVQSLLRECVQIISFSRNDATETPSGRCDWPFSCFAMLSTKLRRRSVRALIRHFAFQFSPSDRKRLARVQIFVSFVSKIRRERQLKSYITIETYAKLLRLHSRGANDSPTNFELRQ